MESSSSFVQHHGHLEVFIKPFQLNQLPSMSKRLIHEEIPGEDERVVAKSKPVRNLVSKTINRSPVLSSSTSQSPGKLAAKCSSLDFIGTEKLVARGSNQNSSSSFQVRQSDVYPKTTAWRLVAETTKNPICTTQSILSQREEIFGTSAIDWNTIPWMTTTLLHDRAVKQSNARVHVFTDSVL